MKHPWFIYFAKALQYQKIERLDSAQDLKNFQLLEVLQSSIYTEDAIFFFENCFFEIGIYGSVFHTFMPFSANAKSNYLTHAQDIDEKFLRKLFTGIEFILYKLCHLLKQSLDYNYNFETEKTNQRIRYLAKRIYGATNKEYLELFNEIWFVRNSFAHSFVKLENIKYRNVELNVCFGESYVGRQFSNDDYTGRIFMDDVHAFLDPLITLFIAHQMEQIDKNKFFRLCDRLLKRKSLTR